VLVSLSNGNGAKVLKVRPEHESAQAPKAIVDTTGKVPVLYLYKRHHGGTLFYEATPPVDVKVYTE
jgi:hypothetical protein